MFDEARLVLGRTLPAGTKVRLAVGPQDRAAWYVIDLTDFELVPPPLRPAAGSLSVAALRCRSDRPDGKLGRASAARSATRAGRARCSGSDPGPTGSTGT